MSAGRSRPASSFSLALAIRCAFYLHPGVPWLAGRRQGGAIWDGCIIVLETTTWALFLIDTAIFSGVFTGLAAICHEISPNWQGKPDSYEDGVGSFLVLRFKAFRPKNLKTVDLVCTIRAQLQS